jgi:hypothetical protein
MIAILAILFFAAAIDSEMSDRERKATGLGKLTESEKTALQQWIDANYQKKGVSQPSSQNVKGAIPTLSENLMNSQYLRLSDGTLWNVRPEDVPIAQSWITPVEIVVTQSSSAFFPYKLTNKVSGSSILARKVEELPQAAPPRPSTPAPQPGAKTQ